MTIYLFIMETLNIVDLIEKNPITKLSSSYNSKLITKIKNCSSSEKTRFSTIAEAAWDSNISAPALRQRIMTNVHINNHHWNL